MSCLYEWNSYCCWLFTCLFSSDRFDGCSILLCMSVIDTIIRSNIDLRHMYTSQCESVCFLILMRLILINGSFKHEWNWKRSAKRKWEIKLWLVYQSVFIAGVLWCRSRITRYQARMKTIPLESLLVSLVEGLSFSSLASVCDGFDSNDFPIFYINGLHF